MSCVDYATSNDMSTLQIYMDFAAYDQKIAKDLWQYTSCWVSQNPQLWNCLQGVIQFCESTQTGSIVDDLLHYPIFEQNLLNNDCICKMVGQEDLDQRSKFLLFAKNNAQNIFQIQNYIKSLQFSNQYGQCVTKSISEAINSSPYENLPKIQNQSIQKVLNSQCKAHFQEQDVEQFTSLSQNINANTNLKQLKELLDQQSYFSKDPDAYWKCINDYLTSQLIPPRPKQLPTNLAKYNTICQNNFSWKNVNDWQNLLNSKPKSLFDIQDFILEKNLENEKQTQFWLCVEQNLDEDLKNTKLPEFKVKQYLPLNSVCKSEFQYNKNFNELQTLILDSQKCDNYYELYQEFIKANFPDSAYKSCMEREIESNISRPQFPKYFDKLNQICSDSFNPVKDYENLEKLVKYSANTLKSGDWISLQSELNQQNQNQESKFNKCLSKEIDQTADQIKKKIAEKKKQEQEQERKKQAAALAAKKKQQQEEEAKKKQQQQEEEAKKKQQQQEEEAKKKQEQEEEAKKKQEQEEAQKKQEQEEEAKKKQQQQEEEAKKKQEQEEEEAKKKVAAQEEARRKEQEQEKARKKAIAQAQKEQQQKEEEEEAKKKAEEQAQKQKEEQQKKEAASLAQKKKEEKEAKKKADAIAQKQKEEQEAKKLKEEQEEEKRKQATKATALAKKQKQEQEEQEAKKRAAQIAQKKKEEAEKIAKKKATALKKKQKEEAEKKQQEKEKQSEGEEKKPQNLRKKRKSLPVNKTSSSSQQSQEVKKVNNPSQEKGDSKEDIQNKANQLSIIVFFAICGIGGGVYYALSKKGGKK